MQTRKLLSLLVNLCLLILPLSLSAQPKKLTKAEAKIILDAARADPELCTKEHLGDMDVALYILEFNITEKNVDLYQHFLDCAKKLEKWKSYTIVARIMYDTDPSFVSLDAIPYGYIKQGRFDSAEKTIETFKLLHPDDLAVREVEGYLRCEQFEFKECLEIANDVLKKTKKLKDKKKKDKIEQYSHSLKMKSFFYLGKFKEFEAEKKIVAKKEPDYAKKYEKKAVFAKKNKLAYILDSDSVFPLGIYHLYNESPKTEAEESAGYLVNLDVYNLDTKTRQFKLEVEIDGLTQKSTKELNLVGNEKGVLSVVPPLRLDFDPKTVRANRPAEISVKLYETTSATPKLLLEQSLPVTVLPRFSIPIVRKVSDEIMEDTWEFAASWVTPNASEIQSFLTKAKKATPTGSLPGQLALSAPQVKALYDTLKASGVSYVINTGVFAEDGNLYHEARLPAQVLSLTNAQCLEGSLLFASFLTALNLEPVMIFVPGHAFIAWKPTKSDIKDIQKKAKEKAERDKAAKLAATQPASSPASGPASAPASLPVEITKENLELLDKLYFLETTVVHDKSFEEAVKIGTENYRYYRDLGYFTNGTAFMLDISKLQQTYGYKPQPFDN